MGATSDDEEEEDAIKSQVGSDSEDTDQQISSSASITGFATQLPVSTHHLEHPHISLQRTSHTLDQAGRTDIASEIVSNQNPSDFLRAAVTKPRSNDRDLQTLPLQEDDHQVSTGKSDGNDSDTPPSSEDQELHQQELVQAEDEPYENRAVMTNIMEDKEKDSGDKYTLVSDNPSNSAMPASMISLMRAFRRESSNDRYLPRRVQLIGKEQQEILESEESWQPSLVGKDLRDGTVPLSLLELLVKRADQVALGVVNQVEDPSRLIAYSSNIEIQQPILTPDVSAKEEHTRVVELENEQPSLDSDDDIVTEWDRSSSPIETPPSHLPPNSSPIKTSSRTVKVPTQSAPGSQISREPDLMMQSQPTPSKGIEKIHGEVSVAKPGDTVQTQSTDNSRNESLLHDYHNAHPRIPGLSSKKFKGAIQVHRTPYHTKSAATKEKSPNFSNSLIPGTFDEDAMQKSRTLNVQHPGNAKSPPPNTFSAQLSDFEHDSSEDDLLPPNLHPAVGRTHHRRLDNPNSESYISSTAKFADHKGPAGVNSTAMKRGVPTDNEESQQSRKRTRTVKGMSSDNALATPYDEPIKLTRNFRREHFQTMRTHLIDADNQKTLSVEGIHAQEALSDSRSSQQSVDSMKSTVDKTPQAAISSETNLSAKRATEVSIHALPSSKAVLKVSATVTELYEKFLAAYPDYKGENLHFNAACLLLDRLRKQSKSTHPSLWDDFVFRHFHDYQEYLRSVIRNCGNAMPYESFYEQHVEEPTHLKRILRLHHFDSDHFTHKSTSPISRSVKKPSNNHTAQRVQDNLRAQAPNNNGLSNIDELHPQIAPESLENNERVTGWLERTAGAESPELGVNQAVCVSDLSVPPLDLQATTEDGEQHSTYQLPSNSSQQVLSSRQMSKPNLLNTQTSRVSTPRPRSSMRKRSSAPKTLQCEEALMKVENKISPRLRMLSSTPRSPNTTPYPGRTKQQTLKLQSSEPFLVSGRVEPRAEHSRKIHLADASESVGKPRAITPDTMFKRFVRDYNTLHVEEVTGVNGFANGERFVDVLSWRQG